ncbi:hypothetical protein PICSAR15_04119 [Mycobacterium avium subsp. paratuberculosis]|nr:hypothetical protein PICSAR15_04119 [Mycobacterium avium subsp. paratuberculosis]CAG7226305.1 hypothetical protein PICSAR26_02069 [Mycobacterium avium subsp. paratuberculosis]
MLRRDVRAQPHVGQQVDALDEAAGVVLGSGDRQPAGPVAGHPVRLRQAVEGQAQHVRRQRRHVDVLGVVVEDLVVDLVGQQQQLVLARQIDHLAQDFAAVHRAGRVVRVDHHQRLGALGDLGFQIGDVGLPALRLVAQVVHGGAAGQRGRRRPQRVVRRRDQHLVAVVEQRLQRHRDQFGHAVAQVDIVDVEAGEPVDQLVAGDHRPARGQDALRVGVALGVRQGLDHVAHDDVGRLEAERRRVADVELEDAVSLGLQPRRVLMYRAADLVQDVLELGRLGESTLLAMVRGRVHRQLVGCHTTNGAITVH